MFFSNNQALFHLWWREIWSKIKKSSKYYDHDSTLFWFLKISKLWNCYIGLLFLFLLFFILFIFLETREYSKSKIEEMLKYWKIIHTVRNLQKTGMSFDQVLVASDTWNEINMRNKKWKHPNSSSPDHFSSVLIND